MKRGKNKVKSFAFEMRRNTKTFEKKPNRGGTPANERISRLRIFVYTFDTLRCEKE